MPELPEVETVRRGLEPVLANRRIARLEQRRPDLRFPLPEKFSERLCGRRIETLARRAKYLLAHIEGGETLIMHLGMSGRFTIALQGSSANEPGNFARTQGGDPRHDHVVFHTDGGASVTYNDPRRFGFMVMTSTGGLEDHPLIRQLGPEPLGNTMNADYLAARARSRQADLKAFLMDQRNISGLGNIYVCEALHRAGLSPIRAAACLAKKSGAPTERAERIASAIRAVLNEAIAAGGSSLRDYRQTDGGLGYFQHAFSVYGRAGEACLRQGCRGTVRRTVQAGRSTFHCPACQR